MSHPFHGRDTAALYASQDRTRQRSDALLSAKASGRNISEVICGLADTTCLPARPTIIDVGLYHSPAPHLAICEIARTLRPQAAAIFVTKAADSYHELASLLAISGLDPAARKRPSLYETAHSGNLQHLTEQGGLRVDKIEHETHTFTFADLAHASAYLATCPQYPLAGQLRRPEALAAELRARLPDGPVTTTATINYVLARTTERTL